MKLSVLEKIAKILNQNKITWAISASLLLYFKGIVDDFQDIDIMISEEDVLVVTNLLANYGTLQQNNPNSKYKTRVFLEYVIDNVEIDIMAGFIIVANNSEYYFPLTKKSISEIIVINDTPIPLQSIEEWKTFYSLMGRMEKVKLIERKLHKGYEHSLV